MNRTSGKSVALFGAALLAIAPAALLPALADDQKSAESQGSEKQQQFQQMQARMQAMHALMTQIRQATDPAVRQRLMDQQMQLMRAQMTDMDMMDGMMKGHGMMGNGMN